MLALARVRLPASVLADQPCGAAMPMWNELAPQAPHVVGVLHLQRLRLYLKSQDERKALIRKNDRGLPRIAKQ